MLNSKVLELKSDGTAGVDTANISHLVTTAISGNRSLVGPMKFIQEGLLVFSGAYLHNLYKTGQTNPMSVFAK